MAGGPDADGTPRVTLDEVAAEAGVSRAAASLALRGKPGVGDDTRQRILDVAAGLGYRLRLPGQGAGVAAPVTGTIGLLVKSRPADIGSTNAFYAPVVAGISRACTELRLDLRLDSLAVDDRFDPVEVPRMLQAGDVDGLVILGAFLSQPTAAMVGDLPLVLVDGYAAERGRFPSLVTDNTGCAEEATRHLIRLGHRTIAVAGTSPTAFPSILDRRRGYEQAMAAAGLEPVYADAPHDDPARAARAVVTLLDERPDVTALVAANDAVALEVLAELGGRVPDGLSLVGFDDIDAAVMVRPRLDTVAVDKQAMGRLAVSLLRHRIANPEDPSFTLVQQARLVVRETSAPPRPTGARTTRRRSLT